MSKNIILARPNFLDFAKTCKPKSTCSPKRTNHVKFYEVWPRVFMQAHLSSTHLLQPLIVEDIEPPISPLNDFPQHELTHAPTPDGQHRRPLPRPGLAHEARLPAPDVPLEPPPRRLRNFFIPSHSCLTPPVRVQDNDLAHIFTHDNILQLLRILVHTPSRLDSLSRE